MANLKAAKVVGAVVLGAAVGAAIGVLFAPDKGSKTRNKIMSGAKGLGKDLKKKVEHEASKLEDKLDRKIESIKA